MFDAGLVARNELRTSSVGQHLSANLTTARALKHEGLTRSGPFRPESRLAQTF